LPGGGGGDIGESWISSFLCIKVVTKIEIIIIAGSEVGDIGYTVKNQEIFGLKAVIVDMQGMLGLTVVYVVIRLMR
jgi:hypothetical protein